jgi:hypothetical protein
MKKMLGQGSGYTMVEVMIFLAVTGALFVAIAGNINGQQRKTEFLNAVRDTESRLRDILNDVATGYYTYNPGFSCTSSLTTNTRPVISAGTTQQGANAGGANAGCIYLGRAVQFAPQGTTGQSYRLYSVIGRQKTATGKTVQNLAETIPTTLTYGNSISDFTVGNGATIAWVSYYNGATPQGRIGAITMFGSLGQFSGNNLASGSSETSIYPLTTQGSNVSDVNATQTTIISLIDNMYLVATPVQNPSGGVKICINSGGTNQSAIITIGGSNRRTTIDSSIKVGSCSTNPS